MMANIVTMAVSSEREVGFRNSAAFMRLSVAKGERERHGVFTPWAKRLANLWRRVNVRKNARAVRGQEIKWEIPD
jgi:hypothetical protein